MPPRRAWLTIAAGVFLYLAVEAALFRSGLYQTFLAPASYAGNFEFLIEAERTRPIHSPNQILAIGDSRMALRTWQANSLQSRFTFGNAGIASSTPRVWHYALRELDPQHNRYAAILILIDDYDDEDVAEDLASRTLDVQLLACRLGIADIPEVIQSYPNWHERIVVLKKILLKGFAYQRDLQVFLQNPAQRLAERRFHKAQWDRVLATYVGETRSLAGLTIDFDNRTAHVPDPAQREIVENVLLRYPEPQTGRTAAFRRLWLGKIAQRYAGTRTRLLFARVPRGPIPRPAHLVRKLSSSLREMAAANPHITLLPEDLLNELEQPELFQDPLHLNAAGSRRLTEILVRQVANAL